MSLTSAAGLKGPADPTYGLLSEFPSSHSLFAANAAYAEYSVPLSFEALCCLVSLMKMWNRWLPSEGTFTPKFQLTPFNTFFKKLGEMLSVLFFFRFFYLYPCCWHFRAEQFRLASVLWCLSVTQNSYDSDLCLKRRSTKEVIFDVSFFLPIWLLASCNSDWSKCRHLLVVVRFKWRIIFISWILKCYLMLCTVLFHYIIAAT